MTACLFPVIVFGTGFIVNFFLWSKKSSGAVPFTTVSICTVHAFPWAIAWPQIRVASSFALPFECARSVACEKMLDVHDHSPC